MRITVIQSRHAKIGRTSCPSRPGCVAFCHCATVPLCDCATVPLCHWHMLKLGTRRRLMTRASLIERLRRGIASSIHAPDGNGILPLHYGDLHYGDLHCIFANCNVNRILYH